MVVARVAAPAVAEGDLGTEAWESERVSRSASELESASLSKSRVANLPEKAKP